MRLNASILFQELKKKYLCEYHGKEVRELHLHRPEFYMDREALLREQQQAALIKRHGLEAMKLRLEGAAPQRILERGYACVLDDKGKLVSSAKQVQPGQNVSIDWADGRASACITGKENTHGGQKL